MKLLTKTYLICILAVTVAAHDNFVTYLEPDESVTFKPLTRRIGFVESELRTYCYRGATKTIPRIFESVELQLDIENDDYQQYEGTTPAEVQEHYEEQRSLFSFNLLTQKRTRVQISPFGQQCIGIETAQPYRVKLQQLRIDFWRVIQITIGVLIFVYAGQLSHNAVFFYAAGIIFGICSSFMLLVWLLSKLVPKRPAMLGVLLGGWTVGVYIIQLLWHNVQLIVVTYRSYVFWYILTTGVISFLFCYRWGPPKNRRSKNIIKWILQFIALVLIYLSSYFEEATVAIIVIMAVMLYFPRSWLASIRAAYVRYFPPKRRLLTNEEYFEQGVKETTKALEELRKYASSPECKPWRVMNKLKEPMRFAAFVEGASHLRDEEILHFESSQIDDDIDLDDDDEDNSEISGDESDNDQNQIEEMEDDEEVFDHEQNARNSHSTPNRAVYNSIHTRYAASSPRYSTPHNIANDDTPTLPQRHTRASYMVNAAKSVGSPRNGIHRPHYMSSDSED